MVYPVFDSASLPLVEELFEKFQADANSVGPEWKAYFSGFLAASSTGGSGNAKDIAVYKLVTAWRELGHRSAKLDPLGLEPVVALDALKPEFHGLGAADMSQPFATHGVLPEASAPLGKIVERLQQVYGTSTAVENAAVTCAERRNWVQHWWEQVSPTLALGDAVARRVYAALTQANMLEKFLHTKFVGAKRFSIEGNDGMLAMLRELVEMASADGVKHVVLGMAHRGRLNVLCNLMHKPLHELLAAFADKLELDGGPSSGDVKYHMGKVYNHHAENGADVELELMFNPSHLEAVNPMVMGAARAKGFAYGDKAAASVLPVIMHGDSAVSGQGVVAEMNNMSGVGAYDVGGIIHIVTNNQVGFTATPEEARGGVYCTDIFKSLGCPIVHVNADDAEACWKAVCFAWAYRKQFGGDVIIDQMGYRRWGHNEGDDPTFTQPVMYDRIKGHPVPAEVFKRAMVGRLAEDAVKAEDSAYTAELNEAFALATKGVKLKGAKAVNGPAPATACSKDELAKVAKAWAAVPQGFVPHPKVAKVIEERIEMLNGAKPLNWGAAETAAYGTLLQRGIGWRLTAQDARRGTFSHRHAVLVGSDDSVWSPLKALAADGAVCEVENSVLSENAVMAYEYGYAHADRKSLVMWEGQFGDFANGAQVVADQFLSAAEAKWGQMNGLVLLLPHGYEGQGPEHSSARLERYLQLCAEDNMRVAMPSTPAQIFHLLRRQALWGVKRPLIVMTPKSLLRNPRAVSEVNDLVKGKFMPVIADGEVGKKVKRIALCSGKVYYDLLARKEETGRDDVAIVRVEELYPWPAAELAEAIKPLKCKDVYWVQEEPRNMGSWTFVRENWVNDWGYLHYAGRVASASTAVGTTARHLVEQKAIVDAVFGDIADDVAA